MSRLGSGREFDRIRAIEAALGSRAAGLGDDCAALPVPGELVVVSTDTSVEGVHFRREWLTPAEIGYRAAAAALSDLAAAAATPLGVLAAVTTPDDFAESHLVQLMEGVGSAAEAVGGLVVGGDLTRGPVLHLTVTVLGSALVPIGRSGAIPGDGLWVTGTLGGARAALEAWQAGEEPDLRAREAFAHPLPRVAVGRWLAESGVRAMLDLSDGLAGDATHLASASGVALEVELEHLPVHPAVRAAPGRPAALAAALGGEDFELLVALPAGFGEPDAARCLAETGVPLARIGTIRAGAGVQLRHGGRPVTLHGFDHFA